MISRPRSSPSRLSYPSPRSRRKVSALLHTLHCLHLKTTAITGQLVRLHAEVYSTVLTPATLCAAVQREKKEELDALPQSYYDASLNMVMHELQQMPTDFTVAHLDAVVEARASVLEVLLLQRFQAWQNAPQRDCCHASTRLVCSSPARRRLMRSCKPTKADKCMCWQTISTLLSEHVMANYDAFAEGIDEVRIVDTQLQVCGSGLRARTRCSVMQAASWSC